MDLQGIQCLQDPEGAEIENKLPFVCFHMRTWCVPNKSGLYLGTVILIILYLYSAPEVCMENESR